MVVTVGSRDKVDPVDNRRHGPGCQEGAICALCDVLVASMVDDLVGGNVGCDLAQLRHQDGTQAEQPDCDKDGHCSCWRPALTRLQ